MGALPPLLQHPSCRIHVQLEHVEQPGVLLRASDKLIDADVACRPTRYQRASCRGETPVIPEDIRIVGWAFEMLNRQLLCKTHLQVFFQTVYFPIFEKKKKKRH